MHELEPYFLSKGKHKPGTGRCAMEWVSYIAGEPHSDTPRCVSPVLRGFGISLNDNWDDEQRQKLRPYLARCIGTAGDGQDHMRGWLAADWLLRTFTPRFLDLQPSATGYARKLRAMPEVEVKTLVAMYPAATLLKEARMVAKAFALANGEAVGTRPGTFKLLRERDIAWEILRDCGGDAAGMAAAQVGAGAIWDEAQCIAVDAAWTKAPSSTLSVIVDDLQDSVLDLFDRMLPLEPITLPVLSNEERAIFAVS